MDSEIFSATLENRVIALQTATDVVGFSFIVQNSISYLNLELSRNSKGPSYFGSICDCCASKLLKNFINTEEKCRKFFNPSRRLHYTLHLDLPKGRECSLKNIPESVTYGYYPFIPHIAKITPICGFHSHILSRCIEEAFKINVPKLTILQWILKIPFSKVPLLYQLRSRTVNKFIDCFYPEITDSELFKGFIEQFDLLGWMTKHEKPEILEHLLYHARRFGRTDLEEDEFTIETFLGPCLDRRYFLNIGPVLKYINVVRFTSDDYRRYQYLISTKRPLLTEHLLKKAEKWIKRDRINHMLQIIWMYIFSCRYRCIEAATEALRLLWNSFPEPCISFEEVEIVFGSVFRTEKLKDVYAFYVMAVGEFHKCVEPRSLQHLSRVVIRRILQENKIWIPEGISKTGLPKRLQSFLNLEKEFVASKEFNL